jgi:hypothetical protein
MRHYPSRTQWNARARQRTPTRPQGRGIVWAYLLVSLTASSAGPSLAGPILQNPSQHAGGSNRVLSATELEQVLSLAPHLQAFQAQEAHGFSELNTSTVLQLNPSLSGSRHAFQPSPYIWRPDELRPSSDLQGAGPSVIGRYANFGEYGGEAGTLEVEPDDPVLFEDIRLLDAQAGQKDKGLLHLLFNPSVEAQSGTVRFSVFGFGSFKLERNRSNQPPKPLATQELVHDSEPLYDLSGDLDNNRIDISSTVSVEGAHYHSDLTWLLKNARRNPWASVGALLTLMLLMVLATRWVEGRSVVPLNPNHSAPTQKPAEPNPTSHHRRRRRNTTGRRHR